MSELRSSVLESLVLDGVPGESVSAPQVLSDTAPSHYHHRNNDSILVGIVLWLQEQLV